MERVEVEKLVKSKAEGKGRRKITEDELEEYKTREQRHNREERA